MKMQIYSAHMVTPINILWNQSPNSGPRSISISLGSKMCIRDSYGTENEAFYLCGASSKDAGNKISSITKIEESSKDMYHTMFGGMLNNKNLKI